MPPVQLEDVRLLGQPVSHGDSRIRFPGARKGEKSAARKLGRAEALMAMTPETDDEIRPGAFAPRPFLGEGGGAGGAGSRYPRKPRA
jgi:hypothetical protein